MNAPAHAPSTGAAPGQVRSSAAQRTIGVIGDAWTLRILRTVFRGKRRHGDFVREFGVSRAVLSDRLAKLVAQLKDAGSVLGLLQKVPGEWFSQSSGSEASGPDEAEIEAALVARTAAKAARNYKEADRIRDDLKTRGVLVEDSKDGQRWRRV